MNKHNKKKLKAGFSLIEVLVFISILSVFFVVAASVASVSVHNMKISEERIIAGRYAEELVESLAADEEDDFTAFASTYAPSGTSTFCFNNTDPSIGTGGSCGGSYNLGTPAIFNRQAVFTRDNNLQISVDVTVQWQDAGTVYTVPEHTVFTVTE